MAGRAGRLARVGWLAAFIGPPVLAWVAWRQAAARHPVTTVAIGLAYEGIVAAGRFAGAVAGDLAARWRERLADSLDVALRRRVSRFGRRYGQFVLAGLRFIDLKGLATVGPFTPELGEVFVDVSLVFRPPHKIQPGLLDDPAVDTTERHALGDFIDRPEPTVLAIVGGPGSGKTTLLRHAARDVCLRRQRRRARRRGLPILLYLRDHAAAIVADPDVSLANLLRGTLGELKAAEPDRWFEQRLGGGECVVLLDGLDEVARQEDRAKVAAWAEHQIRLYPANDYVITSRPHGYRTAGVAGAQVLAVCGFTDRQVARFVHGWYLAVERHSTGARDEDVTVRARAGAEDLLRRLEGAPALRDLTVNPLLLTMIANVHRYRGALPGSRAELYAEICQVMLWRRQEAKNLATGLAGDKKEALLRGLAFTMMERRLSDLSRDEVLAETSPALRRLSRRIRGEDFLADVGSNGLLVERETELYCFAHPTFQEYLAAAHIRDKGLVSVLVDAVADPWWREATLLYAAHADADPIIVACLHSNSVIALALAFDCADQDSEIAEDLRDQIEGLLAAATSPEMSQERRRLIAGVLLTRHLHEQQRASDGSRICVRPITVGLYQLFLDDTRTPAPDGRWLITAQTETATGMRASDAAAFVQWANAVTAGEATYRLPGSAALDDPTVRALLFTTPPSDLSPAVWIQPDEAHGGSPGHAVPALVLSPDARHPYRIDAATLTSRLDSDVAGSGRMLAKLLVLRSAVGGIALAAYLDHALHHGLARDLETLNLTFDSALLRDLALIRDLTLLRDLTLAHDFDHGLVRFDELAIAKDLDLALNRSLNSAHSPLKPSLSSLKPARDLALNLAEALNHNLDLGVVLDSDHDRALNHALALDRSLRLGLNGVSTDLDVLYAGVMGRALSQALTAALRIITAGVHLPGTAAAFLWPAAFAKALGEAGGIAENSYIVAIERLSSQLPTALQTVAADRGYSRRPTSLFSPWAAQVAHRLQRIVVPVLDRQEQLNPRVATHIRLSALCLAAEADALNQRHLGDTFRETAAGITLLERRASGDAPATETIILAIE
jgi:hypothetical protein